MSNDYTNPRTLMTLTLTLPTHDVYNEILYTIRSLGLSKPHTTC